MDNAVRNQLHKVLIIEKEIMHKMNRLQRLRSQAEKVTTFLTATPKGGGNGGGMSDTACEIADLEDEIKEDAKRCAQAKNEIKCLIASLPEVQRTILGCRYIDCAEWYEVANVMCLSKGYVMQMASEAIKILVNLSKS